jgi:hypothetical protein
MNRNRLLKRAKHSIPPSRGFAALGPAFVLLLLGVSCSKVDTENNAQLDVVALSAIPAGKHKQVCGDVTPGSARCYAHVRTTSAGDVESFSTPSGFGPAALQSAYLAPTGGAGKTVAIVDAYDDPYAESDLATYRSQFGLPPCTTANGCFKKVNQNGATSPLPAADPDWSVEIALDLAMVSAICPSCNITLVEANSATMSDLGTAENAAAALSPSAISNSWGGSESSSDTTYDSQYFNHPGILITVSSGDMATASNTQHRARTCSVLAERAWLRPPPHVGGQRPPGMDPVAAAARTRASHRCRPTLGAANGRWLMFPPLPTPIPGLRSTRPTREAGLLWAARAPRHPS